MDFGVLPPLADIFVKIRIFRSSEVHGKILRIIGSTIFRDILRPFNRQGESCVYR